MIHGQFISVIISAAGAGTRMGKDGKLHLLIRGQSVLVRTLCKFAREEWIDELILVIRRSDYSEMLNVLQSLSFPYPVRLVEGGKERHDSVYKGLLALHENSDIVLIHDGARPFVTGDEIRAVADCTLEKSACALGVPMTDTVKIIREDLSVVTTPDRKTLYRIQTPQGFRTNLLKRAYDLAREEGNQGTDDCSIVEKMGAPVQIVRGKETNIKITTRADLFFGEGIAREEEK